MKSIKNIELRMILFIFFLLFTLNIPSKVILTSGDIAYGTWTKARSPYILSGEIIIPAGKTLNIEAGTVIKCKAGTNNDYFSDNFDQTIIKINGKLIALGEPDNTIKFTRFSNSGNWGMIIFDNNDPENILDYCEIEYCGKIKNLFESQEFCGAITLLPNSKAKILNCRIKNNIAGIHVSKTLKENVTYIYYNQIINNDIAGVLCSNSSHPVIEKNIIENSKTGILCTHYSEPVIKNNILRNISDGIICYNNCNALIENNFINTSNTGIFLMHKNTVKISNNIITSAKLGISLIAESNILIENSIIHKIQVCAIKLDECSNAYIQNTVIWNEVPEFWFNDDQSQITLKYSLLKNIHQPSQVVDLAGNIYNKNPQFIEQKINNFHLNCDVLNPEFFSPCIDAGNPASCYCDNSINLNSGMWTTINDIGAYGGPKNSQWNLPASIYNQTSINEDNTQFTNLYFKYDNKSHEK